MLMYKLIKQLRLVQRTFEVMIKHDKIVYVVAYIVGQHYVTCFDSPPCDN